MHVMQTKDCPRSRKTGELVKIQSEIYCFFLIWITQNTCNFELIVYELGLISKSYEYATDMKLFGKSSFCIDRFVMGIDSLWKIMIRRYILKFTYPHHFVRVETRKEHFSLLNTTQRQYNVRIPTLVLIDLSTLKNIGSSSQQRHLSTTLRLILWPFFIDHGQNFISFLVNQYQFSARVAFLTGEVSDVIDPAENFETMHSFI